MSDEYLDYIEDILDAMSKAETLLEDVTFDLEIVWDVVKKDIPEIKPRLQKIFGDSQ